MAFFECNYSAIPPYPPYNARTVLIVELKDV